MPEEFRVSTTRGLPRRTFSRGRQDNGTILALKVTTDPDVVRARYHLSDFDCRLTRPKDGKFSQAFHCDTPEKRDEIVGLMAQGYGVIIEPGAPKKPS